MSRKANKTCLIISVKASTLRLNNIIGEVNYYFEGRPTLRPPECEERAQ